MSSSLEAPQLLEWHVERHPDRVHLTLLDDQGEVERTLTYAELAQAARRVAAGKPRCWRPPLGEQAAPAVRELAERTPVWQALGQVMVRWRQPQASASFVTVQVAFNWLVDNYQRLSVLSWVVPAMIFYMRHLPPDSPERITN